MLYEKNKKHIDSVSIIGMEKTDRIVISRWEMIKAGRCNVHLEAFIGDRSISSHVLQLDVDFSKMSGSDDRDYLYGLCEARIAELHFNETTQQERKTEENEVIEKNIETLKKETDSISEELELKRSLLDPEKEDKIKEFLEYQKEKESEIRKKSREAEHKTAKDIEVINEKYNKKIDEIYKYHGVER